MAYYKLTNPTGNSDDHLRVHEGRVGCCGDDSVENEYHSAETDLTVSAIESVTFDGSTYTFTTAADTLAKLKAGIKEALEDAGYTDIKGVGVSTSGADATAVAIVKTTATMTKLTNAAAADFTFTAQ